MPREFRRTLQPGEEIYETYSGNELARVNIAVEDGDIELTTMIDGSPNSRKPTWYRYNYSCRPQPVDVMAIFALYQDVK